MKNVKKIISCQLCYLDIVLDFDIVKKLLDEISKNKFIKSIIKLIS